MQTWIKNEQSKRLLMLLLLGSVANAFLFAAKFYVSYRIQSLALRTESYNHLGDLLNGLLFVLALFYSKVPADKEHPYGHERMEYLAGIALASTLFYLGISLLKESLYFLFFSENGFGFYVVQFLSKRTDSLPTYFSYFMLFSIFLKLGLYFVYRYTSQHWNFPSLQTLAEDSRFDASQSLVLLLSLSIEPYLPFAIDKVLSVGLSIYMMFQAGKMWLGLLSQLLGEGLSDEERKTFLNKILSFPHVLGCHDLRVHRYGSKRICLTCHVELSSTLSFEQAHTIADEIEYVFWHQEGIELLVHIDPVREKNQMLYQIKKDLQTFLKTQTHSFYLHDVQFLPKNDGLHLHFEIMLPYEATLDETFLKQSLKKWIVEKAWTFKVHFYIERGVLPKQ